jgi:hypothetical protein
MAYMRLPDMSNYDPIFSCYSETSSAVFALYREGYPNHNTLTARFDPLVSKSFTYSSLVDWNLLVIRYDPSGDLDFVVDGVKYSFTVPNGQSQGSVSFGSCYFGKDYASNSFMSADVAAFYVYERALTDAEIASAGRYLKSLSGLHCCVIPTTNNNIITISYV